MKYLLLFIVVFASVAHADDCQELVRSLFKKNSQKVSLKKTEKVDITKYGLSENIFDRNKFERLYLQCMSSNKPTIQEPMRKKFSFMQHKLGVATTVVGYSAANWHKPKDMQWFGKMAFGVAFSEALGRIAGKLIIDNGNRFQFLIKDYLLTRAAVAAYLGSAPMVFDNEKSQRKKMYSMNQEELRALHAYADKKSFLERFQNEVISYLSHLEFINLGLGQHQGVDFNHLTPADLEDKDVQKVVIAAIVAQEYENQSGLLNITESNSVDFFLFDALYSIVKIPKDLAVSKVVDQVLCLNAYNPTRGLTQAIGISALNQIMFADFFGVTYRVAKKEFINQ